MTIARNLSRAATCTPGCGSAKEILLRIRTFGRYSIRFTRQTRPTDPRKLIPALLNNISHIRYNTEISAMEGLPEWQVHDAAVYHTYEVEAADHLSMGVSLYIPLDPNHRNMGEFRIAVLGGDDEEVCVPALDVYHVLPPEIAGTMLHFSFSSMKTLLPGNSTSCPWQDATTLIRKFAV